MKYIIGDREFGGVCWYNYLNDNGITFVIRIKENQKVYHDSQKISVKNIVKSNSRKGRHSNNKNINMVNWKFMLVDLGLKMIKINRNT
ncbi:MAG: transposase [Saprospiraceae bacterium]|nr:transposase [Saprospiraceae bacterium]